LALTGLGLAVAVLVGSTTARQQVQRIDFVNRALDWDLVQRARNSDLVQRLLDSEIMNRLGDVNIAEQINIDPEVLRHVRDHGTLPNIPTGSVECEAPLILSAKWGQHDGGRSLAVKPSECVRKNGLALREEVWAALLSKEPEANVPGMRDQLLCHMLGAQSKPTWNLEPWRRAAGLQATLLAACNPE
jgi:hypothetical protein